MIRAFKASELLNFRSAVTLTFELSRSFSNLILGDLASELILLTILAQYPIRVKNGRPANVQDLQDAERRFFQCCQQIVLIDQKLDIVQTRYNRADSDNFRSMRYSIRLQLATIEGVRNAYYEYAKSKAQEMARLRQELFGVDTAVEDYVELPDEEDVY